MGKVIVHVHGGKVILRYRLAMGKKSKEFYSEDVTGKKQQEICDIAGKRVAEIRDHLRRAPFTVAIEGGPQ